MIQSNTILIRLVCLPSLEALQIVYLTTMVRLVSGSGRKYQLQQRAIPLRHWNLDQVNVRHALDAVVGLASSDLLI